MTDDPARELPDLELLVAAADDGLHPWIRERVPAADRRAALAEELDFWLNTAARDLDYAGGFARAAPQIGQPVTAYLDRWLPLNSGTRVLAGPRYLGRDPDLPFVGIPAADRPLTPADQSALIRLAQAEFAPFRPKFVLLDSAEPPSAWPGCRSEKRVIAGRIGDLRAQPISDGLSTRPAVDDAGYDAYKAIYDRDQAADRVRKRWAQAEDPDDFVRLGEQGMLFDVLVDSRWAGVVSAEVKTVHGIRGPVVQELVLDQRFRGRGLGHQLSLLLARALPVDDDQLLIGTIHADNVTARQSALRAGRVDVGGEILIPL